MKHSLHRQLILLFILFWGFHTPPSIAQEISRSFELRYVTADTLANGETDFKGDTEYFDTEQRIEYLEKYELYAQKFFSNPNWDQLVVSDEEAKTLASKIKKQPLPKVRKREHLNEWKCLGHKDGLVEKREAEIRKWSSFSNISIANESLLFEEKGEITYQIPEQDWRSLFKFSIYLPKASSFKFSFGEAVQVDQTVLDGESWTDVSIDFDFENKRYNLFINNEKRIDFKPISEESIVNSFIISASKGVRIDNIHGIQYTKGIFTENKNSRDIPYNINTFILEDFKAIPGIENWYKFNYDDTLWGRQEIPFPHGGERYRDESLYMRKVITPPKFKVAELNFETIDPGGEIWINGNIVHVQHNRHPVKIDISKYILSGQKNILAVRVFPNKVEHTNRHTSADIYTGAFAGRAWIDYRDDRFIEDVFIYTKSLEGKNARLILRAGLRNNDWQFEEREMKKTREFHGNLHIKISKWFPQEATVPIFQKSYPIKVRMSQKYEFEAELLVSNPDLWNFQNPNLYKVECILKDTLGKEVDDFIITTGIRKITQEGGTFRINGKPEMMNGALLFGYKYPLQDIARTLRSAEPYWLVKEIEMIKRMNANTIRMSVHHGSKGGINDPRLAEIGDQMGIMFQWTTSTWVRSGSPWLLDFEGLPKYVKQVRNHPSIVMWQVGNHPKYIDYDVDGLEWFSKVYSTIYPDDPSRFIVPVGSQERLGKGIPNDEGTTNLKGETITEKTSWTAPMIPRGNFDHTTGYGAEWTTLRNYPYPKNYDGDMGWRSRGFREDYLNSKERAYFDYESEESVGQANWELRKGKPSYQIKSYELLYDEGSIGRQLGTDEWRTSQAWQAFSAYEAYRKKRWLDYDGLAWCTLHGGGNTGTYQKPLIDYFGYSKMVYHALGMVFQRVLAGSKNVDLVYGPDDLLPIIIMNLGQGKKVDLLLTCKNTLGVTIFTKEYQNIQLEKGRSVHQIGKVQLPIKEEGYYIFEYKVIQQN